MPQACCENTRWWGAACPPPSAVHCPSTTCASSHLTMLSPSLASGALCLSWRRWRSLQGKLSTVDMYSRNPPLWLKNFGIWLCYTSWSHTHNMHWKYCDLTFACTITQCYWDLGARHHAQAYSIYIMKVEKITDSKCHQPAIKQFYDSKIKFLLSYWVHVTSTSHTLQPREPAPSFRFRASLSPGLPK